METKNTIKASEFIKHFSDWGINDKELFSGLVQYAYERSATERAGKESVDNYFLLFNNYVAKKITSDIARNGIIKEIEKYKDFTIDFDADNIDISGVEVTNGRIAANELKKEIEELKQSYPILVENLRNEENKLTEKDLDYIHSEEFISKFGDWEKANRLEKLKQSEPLYIDGKISLNDSDITETVENLIKNKDRKALQALEKEIGKTVLGTYKNQDTGLSINVSNRNVTEVSSHHYLFKEHIQSLSYIPKIIDKAVFIGEIENGDKAKHPNIEKYLYFGTGLKIDGEDYTCKSVIGIDKSRNCYYDQSLSTIEKGRLVDYILENKKVGNLSPLITQRETDLADTEVPYIYYDKRLMNICQVPQMPYLEMMNGKWQPTYEAIQAVNNGTLFIEKKGQTFSMVTKKSLQKEVPEYFPQYENSLSVSNYNAFSFFNSKEVSFLGFEYSIDEADEKFVKEALGIKNSETDNKLKFEYRFDKDGKEQFLVLNGPEYIFDTKVYVDGDYKSEHKHKFPEKIKTDMRNAAENYTQINFGKSVNEQLNAENEMKAAFAAIDEYCDNAVVPKDSRFILPSTPEYLKRIGSDETEITLPVSVVKKAMETHHLTKDEIKSAVFELYDPVLVFDSDKSTTENKVDSRLVLTNEFKDGKPLALAINVNSNIRVSNGKKSLEVQEIRSIHDRILIAKNGTDLIQKWTEDGLCRYVDDKKITDWSNVSRVYFPIDELRSDSKSILQKSDIVNERSKLFVKSSETVYETEMNQNIENPFLNADKNKVQELYEQAEAIEEMQQKAALNVEFNENGKPYYPKSTQKQDEINAGVNWDDPMEVAEAIYNGTEEEISNHFNDKSITENKEQQKSIVQTNLEEKKYHIAKLIDVMEKAKSIDKNQKKEPEKKVRNSDISENSSLEKSSLENAAELLKNVSFNKENYKDIIEVINKISEISGNNKIKILQKDISEEIDKNKLENTQEAEQFDFSKLVYGKTILPPFAVMINNKFQNVENAIILGYDRNSQSYLLQNGEEKISLKRQALQRIIKNENTQEQTEKIQEIKNAEGRAIVFSDVKRGISGTIIPEFSMITSHGFDDFKNCVVSKYNKTDGSYTLTNGEKSLVVTNETFKELISEERFNQKFNENTKIQDKMLKTQYDDYFKIRDNKAYNFVHNFSVYCRNEANSPCDAINLAKDMIKRMSKTEKAKTKELLNTLCKNDKSMNEFLIDTYHNAIKDFPLNEDYVKQYHPKDMIALPFYDTVYTNGNYVENDSTLNKGNKNYNLKIGDTISNINVSMEKLFGHGKETVHFDSLKVISSSKEGNSITFMDGKKSFIELPRDSFLAEYVKRQEKNIVQERKNQRYNAIEISR